MKEAENQDLVNTNNLSTKYGLGAGLSIAIILLLFQISGDDFSPFLKIAAMIPLAIFISLAFNKIKSMDQSIFTEAVPIGLKLSLIAGLTVVAFNVLLFLINSDISFSKYAILPDNGANFIMISVILFFEIMVFGGVMTFILMQSMKRSSKTE